MQRRRYFDSVENFWTKVTRLNDNGLFVPPSISLLRSWFHVSHHPSVHSTGLMLLDLEGGKFFVCFGWACACIYFNLNWLLLWVLLVCFYCNFDDNVQSCQARPNIDATSPVDCECIMPLESLLANFKLLAVDSFLAAYKRCNEYGCWISCCELLTFACATAFATLSMSVVEAVKPLILQWTNGWFFPMSKQNDDFSIFFRFNGFRLLLGDLLSIYMHVFTQFLLSNLFLSLSFFW